MDAWNGESLFRIFVAMKHEDQSKNGAQHFL